MHTYMPKLVQMTMRWDSYSFILKGRCKNRGNMCCKMDRLHMRAFQRCHLIAVILSGHNFIIISFIFWGYNYNILSFLSSKPSYRPPWSPSNSWPCFAFIDVTCIHAYVFHFVNENRRITVEVFKEKERANEMVLMRDSRVMSKRRTALSWQSKDPQCLEIWSQRVSLSSWYYVVWRTLVWAVWKWELRGEVATWFY